MDIAYLQSLFYFLHVWLSSVPTIYTIHQKEWAPQNPYHLSLVKCHQFSKLLGLQWISICLPSRSPPPCSICLKLSRLLWLFDMWTTYGLYCLHIVSKLKNHPHFQHILVKFEMFWLSKKIKWFIIWDAGSTIQTPLFVTSMHSRFLNAFDCMGILIPHFFVFLCFENYVFEKWSQ